jgi:hypothetical protein
MYTDFDRVSKLPAWLTPNHPNWIGAWWLPFLIFGFSALLLASVIFIFPQKIEDRHHADQTSATATPSTKRTSKKSKKLFGSNKLKQDNELHAMGKNGKVLPEKDTAATEVALYVNGDEYEDAKNPFIDNNPILSTLRAAGSLLSVDKLGIKSSQYSLNRIGDSKVEGDEAEVMNPFLHNGGVHHPLGSSSTLNEKDEQEIATADQTESHETLNLFQKSFLLLKKPVYLFLIITSAIEGLLQNSFLAFATLFIEYQYRQPSGSASLILGLLSIPPLMVRVFILSL